MRHTYIIIRNNPSLSNLFLEIAYQMTLVVIKDGLLKNTFLPKYLIKIPKQLSHVMSSQ